MRFSALVGCADRVASRGGRLDKIEALRELLQRLPTEELGPAVRMLSGEIPGGRVGVGPATLREARDAIDEPSDDGAGPGGPDPDVAEVVAALDAIRAESGPGSAARRLQRLQDLLRRGDRPQRDFLVRLLSGELRQGALGGLMVEALGRAAGVPAESARRALMLSGDLAAVARAAMEGGVEALDAFGIELFRPLQPMLASPAESLEDVHGRIPADRLALEIKIDGARVQVHRDGDRIRVYSRQLNDVTAAVPEVVAAVAAVDCRRCVLDGEAFVVRDDGTSHSFQTTMRRFGRSRNVDALRQELPLVVRFFDLLLLDGRELVDEPLERRWRLLAELLPDHQPTRHLRPDAAAAERAFEEALEAGHEGLMAKDLETTYEAGSRGFSWLKVKPVHTLDLVVLAVEEGSGRRAGWLSNLHLGARDEDSGDFVMLGKTFKGLTDDMLRWQTGHLASLETGVENGFIHHVRPELVVEVAFNNLQESPHYPAGIALRFARVRAHRPDRSAADASTLEEVRSLFRSEHGRDPHPVS